MMSQHLAPTQLSVFNMVLVLNSLLLSYSASGEDMQSTSHLHQQRAFAESIHIKQPHVDRTSSQTGRQQGHG